MMERIKKRLTEKWKVFKGLSFSSKLKAIWNLTWPLIFAVVFWATVLTSENPTRIKTLTNVPVSFDGEAELLSKGLCVRGDRSEILEDADIRVQTRLANYTALTAGKVNITVNLKNITEAHTYDLPLSATVQGSLGTVQNISPSSIQVQIDTLVSKTVPVVTTYVGEVPEGYWADMANSTVTTRIDIQGAKTDINMVKRAECIVNLSEATSMIYSTFDVILYDGDGNVISNDIVVGTVPTATVRIPVYATKTVSVDAYGALVGADAIAANHEIREVYANPETVRVVGEKSILDGMDTVSLEPVNITGQSETEIYETRILLPEGVSLPDDSGNVALTVDVRETVISQEFDQVKVEVRNLGEGLTVTALDHELLNVAVNGRFSLLNGLTRSDVSLWIDVAGLGEGTYSLTPYLIIKDEERTAELTPYISDGGTEVTRINVTISVVTE